MNEEKTDIFTHFQNFKNELEMVQQLDRLKTK